MYYRTLKNNIDFRNILMSCRRYITSEAMKLNVPLCHVDGDIHHMLNVEEQRQKRCINLNPCENIMPLSVREAYNSVMSHLYNETNYYKQLDSSNSHFILQQLYNVLMERALTLFHLQSEEWGVVITNSSLRSQNDPFFLYSSLFYPHETIFYNETLYAKKMKTLKSKNDKFFYTIPYRLNPYGQIDYDELEFLTQRIKPAILHVNCEMSCQIYDYKKIKQIITTYSETSLLLIDISQLSGLIATELLPSPFPYADIVIANCNALRGPNANLIFYRRENPLSQQIDNSFANHYHLEKRFNSANIQHITPVTIVDHSIAAAAAVGLKLAQAIHFNKYQRQVLANATALGVSLQQRGFTLLSNKTDTDVVVVDLQLKGISGNKVKYITEMVGLMVTAGCLPEERNTNKYNGLILGSGAMTSCGLMEDDFERIASLIEQAIDIGKTIQYKSGASLENFITNLKKGFYPELDQLRSKVIVLKSSFKLN